MRHQHGNKQQKPMKLFGHELLHPLKQKSLWELVKKICRMVHACISRFLEWTHSLERPYSIKKHQTATLKEGVFINILVRLSRKLFCNNAKIFVSGEDKEIAPLHVSFIIYKYIFYRSFGKNERLTPDDQVLFYLLGLYSLVISRETWYFWFRK